ncbi:WG repeat-containing protein [Limibacter armeniacum]|uniref:WG repeat-containing protein n=1 Tax=Limibacter armeniacum TaxID=466084 RepID=UPI002FE6AC5F
MKFLKEISNKAKVACLLLVGGAIQPVIGQDNLVPLFSEDKQQYGYVYEHDSLSYIIDAKYEKASGFDNGKAVVKTDEGYLIIDERGRKLTRKPYDYIGWSNDLEGTLPTFYHGELMAFQQDGYWGLLNSKGKEVIKPLYHSFKKFVGGIAVVGIDNPNLGRKQYGAVSTDGNEVFPLVYDFIEPLLINPKLYKVGHYGVGGKRVERLFSADGKELIESDYDKITAFSNGLLCVVDKSGFKAVFDQKGKQVTPFKFTDVSEVRMPRYLVTNRHGRKGMLDVLSGKEVYQPIHKHISFSDSSYTVESFPEVTVANQTGKALYTLRYDSLRNVGENLFLYEIEGNQGVVNAKGEVIFYDEYEHVSDFVGGRSIVQKRGRYGVIDTEGNVVIPIVYNRIEREQENYFRVTNGHIDIFDKNGNNITKDRYPFIGKISSDMYLVQRDRKYGYLDRNFNEIVPLKFPDAEPFLGDYAVVNTGDYYGVINKQGKWVITPILDKLQSVSEGLFLFHDNEAWGTLTADGIEMYRSEGVELQVREGVVLSRFRGKYGLINDRGDECLPAIYDSISEVRDDHTVFMYKDGKRYFKYIYGKGVPKPDAYKQNDWIGEQTEGFAPVKMYGRYGFVDFLGRLRISARYEAVKQYSEGLAPIRLGNRWGYLNKEDQIILQPFYEEAQPFENGMAIIKKKGKYGVIRQDGSEVLQAKFDKIVPLPTGKWLVCEKKDRVGIYARNGMKGIYGKYDQVEDVGNDMVITLLDHQYGLDRIDGFSVIFPKYDLIKFNYFDNTFMLYKNEEPETVMIGVE